MDYFTQAINICYPWRDNELAKDDYMDKLRDMECDLKCTRQGRNTLLEDGNVIDKLDEFVAVLVGRCSESLVAEKQLALKVALNVAAAVAAGRQYQSQVDELIA